MCSIPLGIKLKLKEEAVASACVFYHTFCSAMTESEYDQHVSKILHLHMLLRALGNPEGSRFTMPDPLPKKQVSAQTMC